MRPLRTRQHPSDAIYYANSHDAGWRTETRGISASRCLLATWVSCFLTRHGDGWRSAGVGVRPRGETGGGRNDGQTKIALA